MYIYLISRIDPAGYDEMNSCVVVAAGIDEALQLAASRAGDEGESFWLTSVRVKLELLGEAENPAARVVCRDFNAG